MEICHTRHQSGKLSSTIKSTFLTEGEASMDIEFKIGDIVTPVFVWETMGSCDLFPVGDRLFHGEMGKIVEIGENFWDGGTYYVIDAGSGRKFYQRAHTMMFPEYN